MPKFPIYNSAFALDRADFAHPDRPSLSFGGGTITVHEAAVATRQIAQLLIQAGVSHGDRVMLVARNSPYHMLVHVACARIGAIFVPVSFRFTQYEVQNLVDFCSPRVVICDPEAAERGMFASTGTLMHFVLDDSSAGPLSAALAHGYLALGAGMRQFGEDFLADSPEADVALGQREYPEGLAAILFTSGSSGTPKAVPLTHENLWWGSQNFVEGFEYRHDEVVLAVSPMSHIGGFNGTVLDLFANGGHVVVMPTFDPGLVLKTIEEKHVNIMFGVPTMYGALAAHPDFETCDLSSWRLPLVGGSIVPAPLLGKLAARGLHPINVWGMTELSASGFCLSADRLRDYPGSIGRPFAYVQARIVDPETFVECPRGTEGELWVRGPSLTRGYWHGEEYNEQAFVDGWLRTGDIAVQDEDGNTKILGRVGDLINSGGEGIYPGEVENVIADMESVAHVCVAGVPDQVWGERVGAAIVMNDGYEPLTLAHIQAFAGMRLARFKLPRQLLVVEALPVGSSGKVDRLAVARMLYEAASEKGTTATS